MDASHLSRRELLSASLALGTTVALNPLSGLLNKAEAFVAGKTSPWPILRLGEPHAEFDSGIRLAGGEPVARESSLGKTSRVWSVGLMNDADFHVFNADLRSAGADLICTGTHVGLKNFSRHSFQSTPRSQGVAAAFAQVVRECGENALIGENSLEALPVARVPKPARPLPHFTSWEQGLGYYFTMIAKGQWTPSAAPNSVLVGVPSQSSVTYSSFNSFIAKI